MSQKRNNKDRNKSKNLSLFKRILGVVFIFLLLGIISIAAYINYKKNDISEDLLLLINKELKGDFSVDRVSLGSFFSYPKIDVSLQGLQFHAAKSSPTKGELVIDLPRVRLNTDLSKIFSKQVLVNNLTIENAKLYLERDSLGTMIISEAFEPLKLKTLKKDSSSISIQVTRVNLLNTEVVILDRASGLTLPFFIESTKGDFKLEDNKIDGWAIAKINPLEFDQAESFFINDAPIELESNYSVLLVDKKVDIMATELKIGNEVYNGIFNYKYHSKPVMNIELQSNKNGIDLENLFTKKSDSLDTNSSLELSGKAHFSSKLAWKPEGEGTFLETIDTSFKLEGKNLAIRGMDLDAIIEKFKRSQNFNLADVSAVMFAGPAGLAITKGGDFARLAFVKAGDSSRVNHFLAEWRLQKGRLEAQDVALSTDKNRIAMGGWYKVQSDSLQFSINIIDQRGCDLAGQRIYGEAKNPKYSKVKLLRTFFGPVKNFFRNIGFSNCEIIYEGKVDHPETDNP